MSDWLEWSACNAESRLTGSSLIRDSAVTSAGTLSKSPSHTDHRLDTWLPGHTGQRDCRRPGLDLTGVRGVEPPSSQCQPTQFIGHFDPGGSDYPGFYPPTVQYFQHILTS